VFAHARDINLELTPEELNEVVQSEKVHSLYQALSRGSCRVMKDGKAMPMNAYIFSHDFLALKKALKVAMPGIRFANYKVKYLKTKAPMKEECKEVFLNHLSEFEGIKISTKNLYAITPDFGGSTKKGALKELLDDVLVFDWERQGRSLVRLDHA
jgi:hypothetical protein